MIAKRMFVRIGLLVFSGILCSLLISCGSAETTPQPKLYTLEEALTLAAQTLQAESQVATPSKTPTPVEKASVSNEQSDSKENPEEPVVPDTGDNAEETGSSNSGDNNGETGPSPKDPSEPDPDPKDPSEPDPDPKDPPEPDPYPKLPEKKNGTNLPDPVDLSKIHTFSPNLGGSINPAYCQQVICPGEKVQLKLENLNGVGPIPRSTSIPNCEKSGVCGEKKEEPEDPDEDQPYPVLPIEILQPPIWPPGYEPPVFQLP